jgi:hypothetical protein
VDSRYIRDFQRMPTKWPFKDLSGSRGGPVLSAPIPYNALVQNQAYVGIIVQSLTPSTFLLKI